MAPNAEQDLLVSGMPRAGALHPAKERLRPPTYNAEDYAMALRRWGRRALSGSQQQPDNGQGTLPSTCASSSSSGYASGNNAGEMTLRQFTSVSELLNKLRADLRLAFPSFVQEFATAPAEGVSLLLETLRGVQLSQSQPAGASQGPRRPRARRAALDELGCVECLAACAERCPDAARILAQAPPGLLALAVCLTSSLNRSRVLALQLLTKVCQAQAGHAAVSEAVSTLRLRYGEGGRFRFLAGALLAAKAALALRIAGVSFLNAFLSTAPTTQTKLYIQAEACEAGLEPRALQEWLKYVDDEEPASELLREEVRRWSRHCVDVEALQSRARRAEETCRLLGKKVAALQQQLHKLQLERLNEYNSRRQQQAAACSVDRSGGRSRANEKKVLSSAEDEGISFSERSSSPEERAGQARRGSPGDNEHSLDNDRETTIDDVIEELRTIVKDAEEELHDWDQLQQGQAPPRAKRSQFGKGAAAGSSAPAGQRPSQARECLRSSEESARLDRHSKSAGSLRIAVPGPQPDEQRESAIVPAIIHPQPPRRAPPCLLAGNPLFLQQELANRCAPDDSEQDEDLLLLLDDDDDDGSDSLLSASRLNYHQQQAVQPRAAQRQAEAAPFGRRSGDFQLASLADFEISETILDERVCRQPDGNSHSLGSRQYSRCGNTVQRRTERRKYLRRCQSQDHIEQQAVKPGGGGSVVEHIRKFESMNSFDERRSLPSIEDSRLHRSESFHQTRLRVDGSTPRRAGSDATSRSLDRIDEGLDAALLGRHRGQACRRLSGDERSSGQQPGDEPQRKYTSFLESRPGRQQQQRDHSGIFAGGRSHDVLGIGRSRFNAGKYSGSSPHTARQQYAAPRSRHGHASPPRHARAKVTDMPSGLY
ncbi:uncharacterized protein LOC131667231 isoform X2 [Phymastichus coffea]|nr:uncharacterized protein LOC131667231 isoform X2 [Phymastichus coffea]